MSVNPNSLYVLKTTNDKNNYLTLDAIPNFSFCGSNEFTISFSFLYDGYGRELIEVAGILSIFLESAKLSIYTQGFTDTISLDNTLVIKEDFIAVDYTYDKQVLRTYINGALFQEKRIAGSSATSRSPIMLGRCCATYISRFRVAKRAFTDAEIRQNTIVGTINSNQFEVDIDFSAPLPLDRGKNKLSCALVGASKCIGVSRALATREQGYLAERSDKSLPASGTIISKVNLCGYTRETGVIFSYGKYGGDNSLSFGIRSAEGKSYAFVKCCGLAFEYSEALPNKGWTNFAVTYNSTAVKLYIDGEEKAGESFNHTVSLNTGKIVVGNALIDDKVQGYGFPGYIEGVYLFKKTLTAAEIAGFNDTPPFVFEPDVLAIYSFNERSIHEQLSKNSLVLVGVDFLFAEDPDARGIIPDYEYRCPKSSNKLTASERWKATVLLDITALFLQEEHSVRLRYPKDISGKSNYPDTLLLYTVKRVLPIKEAQLVLGYYKQAETNQQNIIEFMDALSAIGELTILSIALCEGKAAVLRQAAKTTAVLSSSNVSGALVCMLACAGFVSYIISDSTEKPPEQDDNDDDDDGKGSLFLQSITFRTASGTQIDTSAIPLCKGDDTLIQTPEWTANGGTSKCAYVQSVLSDSITIEISLKYKNSKNESCTTTINGSSDLFGEISERISFSAPGSKTVSVKCKNHTIKSAALGAIDTTITWFAELSSGKYQYITTSSHTVHVLANTPQSPFGINNTRPNSLPSIEFLEVCHKIYGGAKARSLVDSVYNYIRTNKIFKAEKENQYANLPRLTVGFALKTFIKDFQTKSAVKISSLDACALFAQLCRVNGLSMNIVEIKSEGGRFEQINEDGKKQMVWPTLFTNPVSALGKNPPEKIEALTHHYINTFADQYAYDMKVYDPYYVIPELSDVKSLPYGNIDCYITYIGKGSYREAFFVAGVCVDADYILSKIDKVPDTECIVPKTEGLVQSVYKANINLIECGTRPNFSNSTKILIGPAANQDICHSISYKDMSEWTRDIINARLNGVTHAYIQRCLNELIEAIFYGATANSRMYQPAVTQLNAIVQRLGAPTANISMSDLVSAASNFLKALFNAEENLRAGDEKWNRSIQRDYDSLRWLHCDGNGNIDMTDSGRGLRAWPVAGNYAPPPPGGNPPVGFYVYDLDDCERIYLAKQIDSQQLCNISSELGVLNACMNVGGLDKYIVYSSSNAFIIGNTNNNAQHDVFFYDTHAAIRQWDTF